MIFGSDTQSCASRQIMQMMGEANQGFSHSYGGDEWSAKAIAELRKVFDCDLEVFFVATGTAANCLALSCLVQPWENILCHNNAHILFDESTAPEFFSGGARLIPISQGDGKLSAMHVEHYFETALTDIPHNSRAGALSLTQASETGLVYSPEEIKAISAVCKKNKLRLHMDGARFANALVTAGCTAAQLTWKSGVDVLCLGATKCGAIGAEAVIFFDKDLAETFVHRRKRTGHLLSKGWIFGAQFVGWLRDDHWLELARHANTQATQLAEQIAPIEGLQIVWPVQGNEIFATMPKDLARWLQNQGAEFYEWYPDSLPGNINLGENDVFVRLVTSFLTKDEQRLEFCDHISRFLSES